MTSLSFISKVRLFEAIGDYHNSFLEDKIGYIEEIAKSYVPKAPKATLACVWWFQE